MTITAPPLAKAVNAYANTSNMKVDKQPLLPSPSVEDAKALKPEFQELVGEALNRAVGAGYKSEAINHEAIADQAELHELVTAVANAELTLNTVVAVRDRIISAYQDIIKMPI